MIHDHNVTGTIVVVAATTSDKNPVRAVGKSPARKVDSKTSSVVIAGAMAVVRAVCVALVAAIIFRGFVVAASILALLRFGLTLTIFSSIVGVAAGAVQGFFGGWIDLLFQRFIEVWSGLPTLFLLIILASFVEPNFWWLLGIMLIFSWMSLVGVVRAEFLRARNFDYVRAARALGLSDAMIMYRHVLPNAMVASLTFLPFILSGSITTLTALDFLGFGLPPGSPSLGEMLQQGKANLQAPWLGITAFVMLSIMLTLLIFIFEAVRDAFDPRKGAAAGPIVAEGAVAEKTA